MILFFINGSMNIIKHDYLPDNNTIDFYEYEMRFLTETVGPANIKIVMTDSFNNQITVDRTIIGLNVIKVNVTPFLEQFNHKCRTYTRITYTVYTDDHDFIGSFPIISPNHNKPLNFVSVAGNSNTKCASYKNIWHKLIRTEFDVILHTGNQILSDYIFNSKIGVSYDGTHNSSMIFEAYANLYRLAYSEESQGTAMRNALNLTILGGHEICSSFDYYKYSKNSSKDKKLIPYYVEGLTAYLKYQHAFHTDLEAEIDSNMIEGYESLESVVDDYNDIAEGRSSIYYSCEIGKYCIIALDECNEVYHGSPIFSDQQLAWLVKTLEDTESTDIIIMSSKSVDSLNRTDSILSCIRNSNTSHRLSALFDAIYYSSDDKSINVFAGGSHKTYSSSVYHKSDNILLLNQLVIGRISDVSLNHKGLLVRLSRWLAKKLLNDKIVDYTVSERKNVSHKISFGYMYNDELYNMDDVRLTTTDHQ